MPTYVSLFCGCGGLDLGFRLAGFRCLQAFDIDQAAVSTYNYNIGGAHATAADLSADFVNFIPSRPDVVIAGPPCQGFSTVGRRDPGDVRNNLLFKPVDLAIRIRARVLLLENVRGVLSGPNSRYWREAIRRLTNSGYTTATMHVSAMSVGLAQIRRRVVLLAVRGGFNPPPPVQPRSVTPLISVLRFARRMANHSPRTIHPRSRTGRIAARIGQGQKLSNVRNGEGSVHTWEIPDVFGPVSVREAELLECMVVLRRRNRIRKTGDADPVPYSALRANFGSATSRLVDSLIAKDYVRQISPDSYDLRRTFNGKYRRLDSGRPAHSVLTKFCDPTHFLHPLRNRPFTVREAARLQGFPDSFVFLGSDRQQTTQVGNAVPVPVAESLALWLRRDLF